MLQIQASHLAQFLARASLGSKVEGMTGALLDFRNEGLQFLAGDTKTKAIVSDCFLPKELFSKYQASGEFCVRDISLLTNELDLVELAKAVDIFIDEGVMKLSTKELEAYVVAAEFQIPFKETSRLVSDVRFYLKDLQISKVLLDKVVKACNIMNSLEVRLECTGASLRFVVPSRSVTQEEVVLTLPIQPSPTFSVGLSSRLLKPVVAALPGRITEISIAENLVLFRDKDFFTSKSASTVVEATFQVILAALVYGGEEGPSIQQDDEISKAEEAE